MLLRDFGPGPAVRRAQDDAAIPSLNCPIGPDAIFRCVPQRVVLALDGQRIRVASGHRPVAEGLERLPLLAYGDSLAVVVHPSWMTAAGSHAFPCVVEALAR